jgi:adenosylcobalamin-dependent ribonucleoside-triphosphate reductase
MSAIIEFSTNQDRAFIEFSTSQDRAFFDLVNPQYISWEFYSQYLDKEPPFGELGAIVYLRTYSRFIEELKRRETWQETVLRNIEYSLSLDIVSPAHHKCVEAEMLFDMMFYLQGFPAGRSLWTAGSKQTLKDPSSNWNCTGKVIDSLSSFSEIFRWLLIGAGTGFSVENKYVSKLPKLNPNVELTHEPYKHQKRLDGTFINLTDSEDSSQYKTTYTHFVETSEITKPDEDFVKSLGSDYKILRMQIGDSKDDWCNALRILLKALTNFSIEKIIINYDPIRPEGATIKTFGGRASGHKTLLQMFDNILKIIKRCGGILAPIDCVDILNSLGYNVMAGGVRRTAELCGGDLDDKDFITAKVDLYTDPNKAEVKHLRTMSNNSIFLYSNPGKERISEIMESIKSNGEPGFWIVGNSQRLATSPIKVTNPCAEAALDDRQSCNLTTKNVKACVFFNQESGKWEYNWELGKRILELITRLGTRITLATQWHPEWDKTQKRDRLLGVSMTGVMDAFDLLEWNYEQQKYFFQWCKGIAIKAADEYHDYLGINRSARVCLMKPEGTISLLPTVSSGIHRSYAPYYLRRVRFSKSDPLAKVLQDLGLKPVPENGQGFDRLIQILQRIDLIKTEVKNIHVKASSFICKVLDFFNRNLRLKRELELTSLNTELAQLQNNLEEIDSEDVTTSLLNWSLCNTWVFTFPIKTNTKTRAIDEPIIEQLERYKLAQVNYADRGHNISITATVASDEYGAAAQWVNDNWDDIIGIAFLPRFDPVEGGKASYPLMPLEPCEQTDYEALKAQLPVLSQADIISKLSEIEKGFEEQELEKGCSTGACPVR